MKRALETICSQRTFEFITNCKYGGYNIPLVVKNIIKQKIETLGISNFLELIDKIEYFDEKYSIIDRILFAICESRTHKLLIESVKENQDTCTHLYINEIPTVLKYCVQLHEYDGKECLEYKIGFGYAKLIKENEPLLINKIVKLTNIFNYYKSKNDNIYV